MRLRLTPRNETEKEGAVPTIRHQTDLAADSAGGPEPRLGGDRKQAVPLPHGRIGVQKPLHKGKAAVGVDFLVTLHYLKHDNLIGER